MILCCDGFWMLDAHKHDRNSDVRVKDHIIFQIIDVTYVLSLHVFGKGWGATKSENKTLSTKYRWIFK